MKIATKKILFFQNETKFAIFINLKEVLETIA
jgi:hypothetical protein